MPSIFLELGKWIFIIGDIVNEGLKKKYNINPNVLDFHRIKLLVQNFSRDLKLETYLITQNLFIPYTYKLFSNLKKDVEIFIRLFWKI